MAQLQKDRNPFMVSPRSDLPVGVQLNWRLRTLILSGRLGAGQTLPSVRQMAKWADVNANTVRAVYDSLQEDGLACGQQGRGTFVAPSLEAKPALEAIALEALKSGQESGIPPHELAIALRACADMLSSDELSAEPPPGVEAGGPEEELLGVRRELRRQIGQLEAQLARYVRDLPPQDSPPSAARTNPHVAGVDELEQVRDALFAKLFAAQQAAEARAKQEAAPGPGASLSTPGPLAKAMNWWRDAVEQRGRRSNDGRNES
jgi:GntR family transcriptional regulator